MIWQTATIVPRITAALKPYQTSTRGRGFPNAGYVGDDTFHTSTRVGVILMIASAGSSGPAK